MTPDGLPKVFVSYSYDSQLHMLRVLELCNSLRANGVDAWIDRYIDPGDALMDEIHKIIKSADFILVVITKRYVEKVTENQSLESKLIPGLKNLLLRIADQATQSPQIVPIIFNDESVQVATMRIGVQVFELPSRFEELVSILHNTRGMSTKSRPLQKSVSVVSEGGTSDVPEDGKGSRNRGLVLGHSHEHFRAVQDAWIKGRLIVICGAGVVKPAGMPSWNELIEKMLSRLLETLYGNAPDSRLSTLIQTIMSEKEKRSPLIEAQFIKNLCGDVQFVDLLHSCLYSPDGKDMECPACESIARLASKLNYVITFNYDTLLEESLLRQGVENCSVHNAAGLASSKGFRVYHPHGLLPKKREPNEIYVPVLTESDYHSQYSSVNYWGNVVLQKAFFEHTCLFIGCSLDDPNLRRLLDLSKRQLPSHRHYILQKSPMGRRDDISAIDRSKVLETFSAAFNTLSVFPIWYDDHEILPSIIDSIRDFSER
jgi:hypothetical protein